jgi:hypothetical protein
MKKKLALIILFGILGVGVYGQTIKSLGYNTTNGQVVASTGTNPLTFTNRPLIKGLNTTNIPAIQWDTSDGKGLGSIFALSKGAATNLWDSPTNAHTNWSILFFGQNIAPNASGTDVAHPTQSMGSSYLTMENNYNFDGVAGAPASETYFVTRDTNNVLTRTFQILGSQTNSAYGSVNMNYRLAVEPATATIENTGSPFVVRYSHPSAGNLPHAFLWNPDTNASRDVRLNMAVGNSPTAIMSVEPAKYFLFRGNYGYAFIARTNGIVIGSTGDLSPSERVHLAGNTRIDGAISFDATSNADITRTNLGLGNGITTNRTFVSYNGTNYTTNSVTISNGIITGWTQ